MLHSHQFSVISGAKAQWLEEGARSAAQIARNIYQSLGFREPLVYVFPSPLSALLAIPHLTEIHGCRNTFVDMADPINNRNGSQDQVASRFRIGGQMAAGVNRPLNEILNPQFFDWFSDFMGCALRELGGEDLLKQRMEIGFFSKLMVDKWWADISASQIWWWPFQDFMVFAERPKELHVESTRGLHKEDGPAAVFGDGYRIYAASGIAVTERIIMHPETITIDEIMATGNAEYRRILILKMGPGEYLKKSGAVLVDMDSLTLVGSAPRALMKDKFGQKWLVGTDGSTARVYTMPVAPDVDTCREAHDSISGFPETRIISEA